VYKRFLSATAVALLCCHAASANFIGTITNATGGGMVTTNGGSWLTPGQVSLSWDVSWTGSTWHYSYTFSTPQQGGLSHMIIEVSPNVTSLSQFSNLSGGTSYELNDFDATSNGNSNPGMPGTIHGIKLNAAGQTLLTLSFDINRAPVFGDFYAKDGNAGGGTNYAYNTGFLAADPSLNLANYPTNPATNDVFFQGHFLVPDSQGGPSVPEPATIVMLASGVPVGLLALRRRFRGYPATE
jgi:hypothetical protein